MRKYLVPLVLLGLAWACSSQSETVEADGGRREGDLRAVELSEEDQPPGELAGADLLLDVDAPPDLLLIGVAVGEPHAPIGIPTAGYGQGGYDGEIPRSPFGKAFAASVKMQTPILAKAIFLKRGEERLLIIRLDKIGTTPDMLDEFTRRLDQATGQEWDGKVLIASNHSHLGPGRLWERMVGEFANDLFWAFYYDLYIDGVLDVALAAIADAEPGQLGHGRTECPECHNDRRCENPLALDSTMRIVRFDRADGSLKALLLNFAIHGTVFGWQDFVLSGDAPGMIEQKVEESFAEPVTVLLVQSWGGDVSPADPEVAAPDPLNPTIPGKYNRLERIGYAAAQRVTAAMAGIAASADAQFASVTIRPPIGYELVGYQPGEWDYPTGGLMCGTNGKSHCWGEEGPDPVMGCIPMPPGVAPGQFVLSAFRLGSLLLFTIPGEPHTDFSLEVAAAVSAATGQEEVGVVGYAQDHWGYIMKEYDWWLGGYEPTVNFWGPRQGDYMGSLIPHVAGRLLDPAYELPFEPQPPLEPLPPGGDPGKYEAMNSAQAAALVAQPEPQIAAVGEALATWSGGDPWLGTPLVTLEREEAGQWNSVIRANGTPLDNRTYHMESSLVWQPTWKEDKEATTRQFLWTVRLAARRNVPTPDELGAGKYRFGVVGTIRLGGKDQEYELTSKPFELAQ